MSQMCCKATRIPGSWPRYKPCKNKAVIEVDGKNYCGVHDPVRLAKKSAERDAAYREQSARRTEVWRLNSAAPSLLSAGIALIAALDSGDDARAAYAAMKSAIAKAKGEA
jgi:hypothetical protein